MDLHQREVSSFLQGGKLLQQNRQVLQIEPATSESYLPENELQSESDAESELQQHANTLLLPESNNPDLAQIAEDIVTKVTSKTNILMRSQVEKTVKCLNIDCKVQELCQQDGILKMRCRDVQMETEGLSQEMNIELRSSNELVSSVKQTLEICGLLQEHYEKLRSTAEQVETFKNGLRSQITLVSNDLKTLAKNHKAFILEHESGIESLKGTVEKERQLRLSEISDADRNYQMKDKILSETMLELKNEEEKYSSLKIQDEELDRNMEEEELDLKEKLKHAYENLHSLSSKNEALEKEVILYKSKEKELEESLNNITIERDDFKSQAVDLEKLFEVVSNDEKILSEKLDMAKERLSYLETESTSKHDQLETYETENQNLLQQKCQFKDKNKDLSGELESARTKLQCSTQDLTDLMSNLEGIQSEHEAISNKYMTELLGLESELEVVKTESDSKYTKLNNQMDTINVLQQEFEEENVHMEDLKLKFQNLKASAADELGKVDTINAFVEEEKLRLEELKKSLLVKHSEVEELKKEVERKLMDHTDYKEEMLMAIHKIKDETKAMKEKKEKRDSECDRKRQDMMKDLRECRNASIKQADEKETELDAQKKNNYNLKEKLNNITNQKELIERDTEMQRKMLECKIRQLKIDLENEITQSAVLNKSQISKQDTSSGQANLKHKYPSKTSSQPDVKNVFDDHVITSDSDSGIAYSDAVKMFSSLKVNHQIQSSDPGKKRRLEEMYDQPDKIFH